MRKWLTEEALDMSPPSKSSQMSVTPDTPWALVNASSSSMRAVDKDTAEAMFPPGWERAGDERA